MSGHVRLREGARNGPGTPSDATPPAGHEKRLGKDSTGKARIRRGELVRLLREHVDLDPHSVRV